MPTSVRPGLEEGRIVRLPLLVAVPSGVVTDTVPLVAASATVAVMVVGLLIVKLPASILPNFTVVTFIKLVPVMITDAPWHTGEGEKDVTVGACAWIEPKLPSSKIVVLYKISKSDLFDCKQERK